MLFKTEDGRTVSARAGGDPTKGANSGNRMPPKPSVSATVAREDAGIRRQETSRIRQAIERVREGDGFPKMLIERFRRLPSGNISISISAPGASRGRVEAAIRSRLNVLGGRYGLERVLLRRGMGGKKFSAILANTNPEAFGRGVKAKSTAGSGDI
jgi:hypothetical protein